MKKIIVFTAVLLVLLGTIIGQIMIDSPGTTFALLG